MNTSQSNEEREWRNILAFLESSEDEVGGRAAPPLSDADRRQIEDMLLGKLETAQRESLTRMLSENSSALEFLASRLNQPELHPSEAQPEGD